MTNEVTVDLTPMHIPQLVRGRKTYDFQSPVYRDTVILLQGLGASRREVYRTIKSKGIFGSHGVECCPVSRYLNYHLPLTVEVATADNDVWIGSTCIPLPDPVARFVAKFDTGGYAGVRSGIA